MPFTQSSLGSEQNLIDDPVLGQGRDPLAPLRDVIMVEGDITIPIDPVYLGIWLTGLFGDPISSDNGDGTYDHEFRSGSLALPSYAIEVGMPEVPAFYMEAGCKVGSIGFDFQTSGAAQASINLIAQGETRNNSSQGGTPVDLPFTRISQFQGFIRQAGVPVANLTSGSLTYTNNLEKIQTIRSDGKIDGADATIAGLSGNINVRYSDNTLIDLASSGTPVDLEFGYEVSPSKKLLITAHEVHLPKPKLGIDGPGGVEAGYDFAGAKNDTAGRMLTVTLTNEDDGAIYL